MIRIIAKSTTKDFWVFHPPAEFPLLDWFNMVKQITQNTPNDVKETCGNASVIGNDRVIFNIKGNDCRLITEIDCKPSINPIFQYLYRFTTFVKNKIYS